MGLALLLAALLGGWTLASGRAAEIGERIQVDRESLPPPYAGRSPSNGPRRLPRPQGAALKAPTGFTVGLFADGLSHARWLCVTPDGDVFLAEPNAGQITLLRDADGDGRAEFRSTYLKGLRRPHGLAFREGTLYVTDKARPNRSRLPANWAGAAAIGRATLRSIRTARVCSSPSVRAAI